MTPPEGSPKKTTSPKKKKVTASAAPAADESVKVAPSAGKEVAKPAPAAKKVAAKKAAPKKAAAKKAVSKKVASKKASGGAAATKVVAQKDAGFGNKLYIRGEGPGLSWEQGVEMTNLKADEWAWTTRIAKKPVEFKILLNDVMWMQGENAIVKSGGEIFLEPEF